jgi:hypothetical protein
MSSTVPIRSEIPDLGAVGQAAVDMLVWSMQQHKRTSAKERKGRARDVLAGAKAADIPNGTKFISFRRLTAAERAQGKSLVGRAAELLARKSQKVAASH